MPLNFHLKDSPHCNTVIPASQLTLGAQHAVLRFECCQLPPYLRLHRRQPRLVLPPLPAALLVRLFQLELQVLDMALQRGCGEAGADCACGDTVVG